MHKRALSREAVILIGVAALAVFALALLSPAIFNDGDTYWHIRAGQWMLAHRAVLTHDPFSLSFAGRPWETQEWLAEIAFAGAFQALGWSGVAILTGAAMAAATAILAVFLARRLDPVPCLVVLVLGIGCVMPDFLARPHILALPFTTLWIIGLAEAVEARRWPRWALLLPMVLWVNLHGSFIFGLALLLPFGLEAVLADNPDRSRLAAKWILFAAAAVAATCLNPHGFGGLVFPFHLMQLKSLASIGEWQSPDFRTLNPVELAFFATVFFFIWRGIRLPAIRLLLLLALAFLWLAHARYGVLLGITGAVLIAGPLSGSLNISAAAPARDVYAKAACGAFCLAFVLLSALRLAWPVKRVDGAEAAVAALPASVVELPVFNNYSFGGVLIFKGIRPLVDSRADLYGDAYLTRYAHAIDGDQAAIDAFFRTYHVAWTMLKSGDPLVSAMDRRPGWRRIYADEHAVIHVGPAALALLQYVPPVHNGITLAHLN